MYRIPSAVRFAANSSKQGSKHHVFSKHTGNRCFIDPFIRRHPLHCCCHLFDLGYDSFNFFLSKDSGFGHAVCSKVECWEGPPTRSFIGEISFVYVVDLRSSSISMLLGPIDTSSYPELETDACGMHFPNCVGLAAGFDKNAEVYHIDRSSIENRLLNRFTMLDSDSSRLEEWLLLLSLEILVLECLEFQNIKQLSIGMNT